MMADGAQQLHAAAVQMAVDGDLEGNLERILQAMDDCATYGVELAVLPETALTGYSPTIGHSREEREWPAIQDALAAIGQKAGALGMWTAVGTEAWDEGTWVNRACVYNDEGKLVEIYDKVHLTGDDTRFYRPGRRNPVFDLHGITVGLQICYDARFPEGYRDLLAQGAQVIVQGFYGAGSGTWKVPVLGAHLRSRAAESGCFVVAANVSGPLQIVVSQIVDPLGLMLAEANQDREEIITAELDLQRIEDSEIRHDFFARFQPAGA